MFIKEYRRVKRAPSWSSESAVWDRTFYVCESKRIDGKPKRIVHGYFKNVLTIDEAIQNCEREIKRIEGNAGLARIAGNMAHHNHYLERERAFLETLQTWKAQFPDWKAEPLGEVPEHLRPKPRSAKAEKPKVTAAAVFDLYRQLDHAGVMAFFELCRKPD